MDVTTAVTTITQAVSALGTLAAAIFAGRAARSAAQSAKEAANAIDLQQEALRAQTSAINLQKEALLAQTFTNVIDYEKRIHFSTGMDLIRGLHKDDCRDYPMFRANHQNDDNQIREVVDFLNHLAHLIRQGYIQPRHILPLYSTSIRACRDTLLREGGWLDGFRSAHGTDYYLNFERLCLGIDNFWENGTIVWPDDPLGASQEMRPSNTEATSSLANPLTPPTHDTNASPGCAPARD
jgi:hypothetical protein